MKISLRLLGLLAKIKHREKTLLKNMKGDLQKSDTYSCEDVNVLKINYL